MFELGVLDVAEAVLAVPVLWATTVMSWWAIADVREKWRTIRERVAAEHDVGYEAPELPASRPPADRYMRALTVVVGCGPVLAVLNGVTGQWVLAVIMTWIAVSAAEELRTQLRRMRDEAVTKVPVI